MPLSSFDPLVREWFEARFSTATEPQKLGWPEIRAGHDVLISAPTGAGKTLSAFLTAIDDLVRQARLGELPNQTQVLYVSPLKALSNDIRKNLDGPLEGIAALARAQGIPLAEIRTARSHRRHARLRTPAHDQTRAAHSGDHAGVAVHPADRRGTAQNAGFGADPDRR